MRSPLRQQAEEAIEQLIALLDALDGDADLEPNGDLEPSLGVGLLWSSGAGFRNCDDDREGRDASDEGEPSGNPQTLNPAPLRAKRITRKAA